MWVYGRGGGGEGVEGPRNWGGVIACHCVLERVGNMWERVGTMWERVGTMWERVMWCGVVWYGMAWYDVVWYGRYGMEWYGVIWCGVVRCGVVCVIKSGISPSNPGGPIQAVGLLHPPAGHSWHSTWHSWARHDEWYDGAGAECVSHTRRVRPRVRFGGMGARRSRRRGCWWQYCRAPLQLRAGAYHSSWRPRQDDWYVAGAMVGSAVRVQRASFLPYGGWWERGLGQGLSAFLGMFN